LSAVRNDPARYFNCDTSVLKTIDCHDRSFIRFAVRWQLTATYDDGNSIALLDYIEDFHVYRRL